jgi:hypothetical protein
MLPSLLGANGLDSNLSFVLDQLPCGTWSFGSTLYLVGFSDVF